MLWVLRRRVQHTLLCKQLRACQQHSTLCRLQLCSPGSPVHKVAVEHQQVGGRGAAHHLQPAQQWIHRQRRVRYERVHQPAGSTSSSSRPPQASRHAQACPASAHMRQTSWNWPCVSPTTTTRAPSGGATCTHGWANTMGSGGAAAWVQAAGLCCKCCTNAAQPYSKQSWHPATATRQDVPLQAPAPPPSAIPRGAWARPAAAGGSAPAGRTPLPGAARPSGRPVLPGRRRPALQPPPRTKRASTPPAVPTASAPAAPSWCRGRRLLPAGQTSRTQTSAVAAFQLRLAC